jgi:glycosyltransferase involved in cell wall biosynthesis
MSNRIAIVIGQLSYGGAERQITNLAKGLIESSDFKPIIFCLSNNIEPFGQHLKDLGVEIIVFPYTKKKYFRKMLWVVWNIKKTKCELVYGILNVGNIFGGGAARILHLPFIASIRSADRNISGLLCVLSRYFSNRANMVIANSFSCITSLRQDLKVHHNRVQVIPNSIIPVAPKKEARARLREEWGVPDASILIGTVGLLKPEKRPEFFLDVALFLNEMRQASDKEVHFAWVGNGKEMAQISKKLSVLPKKFREHVHFDGERSDIADCLSAFDVFVLTSAYEGMPNALLEAMVAGLPCVATNVMGTKDVLLGGNQLEIEVGVLTSAQDPNEFAVAVFNLIRDRVRMEKMKIAAQRYVQEKYSLENMVDAHCFIFNKILYREGEEII